MTSRRFAGGIGVVYVLLGLLGAALYVFPTGLLHQTLHLVVGVWGLTAASSAVASVGYARKTAVLVGTFALLEATPSLRNYFDGFLSEGPSLSIIHVLTALTSAYYGYYWTEAVAEMERREMRKAA